ncbi:MAG: RNA polymerase factor sigma-32 [Magnetococcales bacterium]|nr:RNA polymerase factor sigma-32 [Magnetococcales bacterium]
MSQSLVVSHGLEFQTFLEQVNAAPILSVEEEQDLAWRFRRHQDLQAAHNLVCSHLRLVVKTAREYLGYGFPLPDLVQEGSLGLMLAVKRFDPERSARLSTYALAWIRATIHEFILRSWSMVKIATTQLKRKLFFKLRSAKQDFALLTEEEAGELASRFGTDTATILEVDARMAQRESSLNRQTMEEDGSELIELIPDRRPNQEMQLMGRQQGQVMNQALYQALDQLDERERTIVEARLMTEKEATLEELAQRYSISRERVRQIEKRALEKLRAYLQSSPAVREILQ